MRSAIRRSTETSVSGDITREYPVSRVKKITRKLPGISFKKSEFFLQKKSHRTTSRAWLSKRWNQQARQEPRATLAGSAVRTLLSQKQFFSLSRVELKLSWVA
jgi:hypothetical protein